MMARGAGTPPRDQREEEGQDGKHRIDFEESLRRQTWEAQVALWLSHYFEQEFYNLCLLHPKGDS